MMRTLRIAGLAPALMGLLLLSVRLPAGAQAANLTAIYSFGADATAAEMPFGTIIQASDGALYGTGIAGAGTGLCTGSGVIFKIKPDGTYTPIYNFSLLDSTAKNTDGANPQGVLIQGSDGNLYGTAFQGGTSGRGTVFKVSTGGTFTTLHSFSTVQGDDNADGANPVAGVTQGTDGAYYGVTTVGGDVGFGEFYKVTSSGTFTSLHDFGGVEGANPQASLLLADDGNFYGTAPKGGANNNGTVFQLTPSGTVTVVHFFSGADGANPTGGLIEGSDCYLYGTTYNGGSNGSGTVFRLSKDGKTYQVLYNFTGLTYNGKSFVNNDGAGSNATLAKGTDGNFYGVCYNGGANGSGTVFQVTPTGVLTPLHEFAYYYNYSINSDGANPSGILQASDGNYYGTGIYGGAHGYGTVYKVSYTGLAIVGLSPNVVSAGGGNFTLTVNGMGFVSGATVNWNGTALSTTYVSASQLTAVVPANLIASTGYASVTVTNPDSTVSNTGTVSVVNAKPALTSLSPSSANAGGAGFTLTVKGNSFSASSVVNWNGSALTTTYVSATEIKAAVPASLIANAGKASVTVTTPCPGGGASVTKTFTIVVTTLKLVSATLSRNSSTGVITATISLKNSGNMSAPGVTLSKSTLNTTATSTSLPVTVGNIAAGGSGSATLTYPGSAGTKGMVVVLKVSGTFTGGKFSGALKVTLP